MCVCVCVYVCVWYDGWHLFLRVWVSASKKTALSVLALNPQKGRTRDISYQTGRGRGKEGPRAKQKPVNRREPKKALTRVAGIPGRSAEGRRS